MITVLSFLVVLTILVMVHEVGHLIAANKPGIRDGNCYKAMLLTGRKNEGIYRFYESAGFDRHAKQTFVAKPGTEAGDGRPKG